MANSNLTLDVITKELLRLAHEKSAFIGTVNRQFDDSWSKQGPTGDTLRIRLPSQYTRRTGSRVMDIQDNVQLSTSLVRATQDGVDMRWNSREFAMDVDLYKLSETHLAPAMAVLVSGIESDMLAAMTKATYNVAGTAGNAISSLTAVGQARALLNRGLAPKDGNRCIQIDSGTMGTAVDGLKGLFQDSTQIKEQYREGKIGRTAMADWYENERVWSMPNISSVKMSSSTISTFNITTNGLTALSIASLDTPTVGMVFVVGSGATGIYQCHPETKAAYPNLQQFTVLSGSTSVYVSISPPIYVNGAQQNVCTVSGGQITSSTAGISTAAVSFIGAVNSTYVMGLMYHRDAFTFATAALPLMDDAIKCVVKTMDGISIRLWQAADIRNDEILTRLDILYGFAAIRPAWASRLIGSSS